ncbi:N-glycosylase/DNA lyase [uncultured archaeon]|nr:N-glycosylase/DNA lyase [uncultured archaeon]
MNYDEEFAKGLKSDHRKFKAEIQAKIRSFTNVGEGDDAALFEELAFCLLTPQSKAVSCLGAVSSASKSGILFSGSTDVLAPHLRVCGVRFHRNKSRFLVEARERFLKDGVGLRGVLDSHPDDFECRKWLVENIKGMGLKEASHFLRNVGRFRNVMILDRHILRNLARAGAISKVPNSLTGKKYFACEKAMKEYANYLGIPAWELDLLLWRRETGFILK